MPGDTCGATVNHQDEATTPTEEMPTETFCEAIPHKGVILVDSHDEATSPTIDEVPGDTFCEGQHDAVTVASHPDQDGAITPTVEEMPGRDIDDVVQPAKFDSGDECAPSPSANMVVEDTKVVTLDKWYIKLDKSGNKLIIRGHKR